ncbi:MAG TPA: ester cyclase [Gammaproteobacteria bacterium]|nr:ester cyclase [Gammaproteobacteria bacterium]
MTKLSEKNAKLTANYLNTVILEQNYDIVDEVLMANSINSTDFGVAIGTFSIKRDIHDWFSIFAEPQMQLIDQIATDESVVYRFIETVKHIAPFKSIPATGNRVSMECLVMFRANGEKITNYHLSSNLEHVVRQLVDEQKVDIAEILQQPIIQRRNDYFLDKVLEQLQCSGIHLTIQQLRCLSLWFSGRTSREIAIILNISHRTAEAHLGIVKDKLECKRKKEIFEVLERHGLLHIMQECSNLLLNGR